MARSIRRASGREAQLLDLIDSVYAAATGLVPWPTFLRRVTEATNSELACILVHDVARDAGASAWTYGLPPEAERDYPEWAPRNVHMTSLLPLSSTGRVFRNSRLSRREVRNSPFHAEWLDSYAKVFDNIGVCIFFEQSLLAGLSCNRAVNKPDYGPDDAALMHALVPHLQRAVSIYRRLGTGDLRRSAAADVVDRLAAGVIFLDQRGRVLSENRTAREMLRENDGLSLSGVGAVRAMRPADDGRLQTMTAEACRTEAVSAITAGGALAIRRPSGRHPYAVIISPLSLQQFPLTETTPAAVLFITDPERSASRPEVLRQVFHLTPAEARVAEQLLRGERPADIAEQLSVALPTVRTHVRRLMEKTDARGQSDLVRILMSALAGLGRPGGGGEAA